MAKSAVPPIRLDLKMAANSRENWRSDTKTPAVVADYVKCNYASALAGELHLTSVVHIAICGRHC